MNEAIIPAPELVPNGYRTPGWLRGAHAQTIWPAIAMPLPRPVLRRERWETPDGDFIDLDWADPPPAGAMAQGSRAPAPTPVLALFHGLEGSSSSHYARALMAATQLRGWRGVVIHWRGCSGEPNRRPRAYHSGDSAEIDWILRRLRPDFAAGVSLGANVLLKWLGEQGTAAGFIRAAAGVSAPQDLEAGALALARGFNRMYCWHFLRTLKRKSATMLDRFPGLVDRDRMLAATTFLDFDDAVTAPLHGFASARDYWRRSSCRQFLPGIAVPTLVINALNDPFLPASALAGPADVSRHVTLDYPDSGGHVGFAVGTPPGRHGWLTGRLLDHFAHHHG